MAPSPEQLLRDLDVLRRENARLTGVEAELAAAIESLRGNEERWRLAVDAAQMGLWEWDMLSNRVIWDAKKHDVFGLTYGSFAGTKEAFFELVHPDDRPMLAMAITRAIDDGAPYRNEFRIMAPAGKTRWIANLGQVYRDDVGRPLRMIGFVRDITDRKQAEEELRDAHRMEGIGQLAGGFAHHFNNLLAVIVGHVEMASEMSGSEAIDADLQTIRQAAQRAALLTRQLLTFAGKQIVDFKIINLNDQIEGMRTTLRRLIGEDIELVTQLCSELWNVRADPAQLDLVFMNLAVNAQEAMRHGGTLTIATANVAADDDYSPQGADVIQGEYVMVSVSDTGCGMTEEVAQQIFEPFFTTKEWGADSTGLGLSTCYGVVAQQDGHIRVHTETGRGTTFRIYLPRLRVLEVVAEGIDTPVSSARDTMTVLVVDDDAGVRKLAARILRTRGYSVLEAASGPEALLVARAWHGRIHLLVTDVVMPGMNGWELARRLKDERPGFETLYISGYAENAVVREDDVDRKVNFLQKPFAAGALVQIVRTLLDAPADPTTIPSS
jgi:PAS domain S-box-containing protein